jgi:hypothetical protein
MANDSLRTTLCVRYRAEVVACGILFTAARKLKVGPPAAASAGQTAAILVC